MIELRVAKLKDAKFLFELRNQESNRMMFKDTNLVKWEDHIDWLSRKLKNEHFVIYICTYMGAEVGQFRVDQSGDVSVSLDSTYRNLGLGALLIKKGSEAYKEKNPIKLYAIVKEENVGSFRAFEKAGYALLEVLVENNKTYKKYVF